MCIGGRRLQNLHTYRMRKENEESAYRGGERGMILCIEEKGEGRTGLEELEYRNEGKGTACI